MFVFAILLGIYSYLIFFLGVFGWLYRDVVVWGTIAFAIVSHQVIRSKVIKFQKRRLDDLKTFDFRQNKLLVLFGLVLTLQASVNLIGVLGPELAFDAVWYHLTLPKLYLANHSIDFIPGGLLYYSVMPKLAEMLYVGGLALGNEITVKFIHFVFGILTCLAFYKLSRKFFVPLISLIAVVIFYANLVVAWESMTAYIDLVRAFFEVMALWAFVNWWKEDKKKWFVLSAMMVGLAITTKLLAIGSLVIFVILILVREVRKVGFFRAVRDGGVYTLVVLLVPAPWFVFSYLHTGNPVYPFFTEIYKVAPEPLSLFGFVKDVWILFTQAADPISPVYMMFLPLIVWFFRERLGRLGALGLLGGYAVLAVIIWYFTPRTGGGRFIVPYLPAFSLLCAFCIDIVWQDKRLRNFLIGLVIFVSVISIGYRFAANSKYIPVIIGKETKEEFLSKHLNFAFGDFYDTDGYFKKHIKESDRVLLYGFHNLYYVDFTFIDVSWVKEGDRFNYIAIQNTKLPQQYQDWKLIYENEKTMVKLYRR